MDIPSLLKLLNENNVRYVIIGATAFPVHGFVRVTSDIDIYIDPTLENAQRTHNAITKFGYDTHDLTAQEMLEKKILIHGYVVESDYHPYVKGVSSFEKIWAGSVIGDIEGVPTRFAGLDDLIEMKKAAGRPKDIEDLRYLEKLKTS